MTGPNKSLLPEIDPRVVPILRGFADYLREVLNFGTGVLAWGLEHEGEGDDRVPLTFMLRKFLDILGGIEVQVRESWADAASVSLRSLLEHCIYVEYLSEKDQPRRGLAYITCNYRSELRFLRQLDPSTPEGKQFRAIMAKDKLLADHPIVAPTNSKNRAETIQRILQHHPYVECNAEYERLKKARKTPKWHMLFNEGATTVENLATQLGQAGVYEIIYRSLSRSTHGDNVIQGNLSSNAESKMLVRQLRTPHAAQQVTVLTSTLALKAYTAYCQYLAPTRMHELLHWHAAHAKLRAHLSGPEIIVGADV